MSETVPQFDPALKALLLEETGDPLGDGASDREIAVLARLLDPRQPVPGLSVVASFGAVVTARVRLRDLVDVRTHPNVASLKLSRRYTRTLTRSVPAAGATPESLRRVAGPAGLDGSGVVVGVVDWGVDVGHANLRDGQGRTRLLRLWDQRGGASPSSPAPFGYGRILTREQIDDALATDDVYAALGYDPQDADPKDNGTHGTHVADIAVGTGRAPGAAAGVAPGADLVFVHLKADDTRPEDTLGDSVRVLEAIRYVVDVADSLGRPVVVNCSFGRTGGPKDASPLVTQGIDALLAERPGRQVVVSAGNYFSARMHAAGRLREGEVTNLPWLLPEYRRGVAEIEVWYSGEDRIGAELLDPAGQLVAAALPGEDTVVRDVDGPLTALFHRRCDPNNRDNVINILIQPRADGGRWTLRLRGESISDGSWHAWIERTDRRSGQARFPADLASPTSTIGTIAAGERAIAVAAVDVDHDRPAPFSSAGPTRDLRVKPDVAAPGCAIRAARSSTRTEDGRSCDQLTEKSGTSMATPHVTGTIALMFQAAPRMLTANETARILRRTASRDPLANDELLRYGAGQINAAAACRAAAALGTEGNMIETETETETETEIETDAEDTHGRIPKWPGATQEQQRFMRAVFAAHMLSGEQKRPYVENIPRDRLALVAPGRLLRSDAAADAVAMLTEARKAAEAQRAVKVRDITVSSGYRSASEQFGLWQARFPHYYRETEAVRASLPGGPHGEKAARHLAKAIGKWLAAPGHSNHNNGRAVDLRVTENGVRLSAGKKNNPRWLKSWFFRWLSANAARFNFHQNPSITEYWHWEHRPSRTPATTSRAPVTGSLVEDILRAIAQHETTERAVESAMRTSAGVAASLKSQVQATVPWAITVLLGFDAATLSARFGLTRPELLDAQNAANAARQLWQRIHAQPPGTNPVAFQVNPANRLLIAKAGFNPTEVATMFDFRELRAETEAAVEARRRQGLSQSEAARQGAADVLAPSPRPARLRINLGSLRAYARRSWGEDSAAWQRVAVRRRPAGARIEAAATAGQGLHLGRERVGKLVRDFRRAPANARATDEQVCAHVAGKHNPGAGAPYRNNVLAHFRAIRGVPGQRCDNHGKLPVKG